jgi:hypothetical protein
MRTSTSARTIACGLAVVMSLTVVGCSGQPLSTREKGTGIDVLIFRDDKVLVPVVRDSIVHLVL